MRIAFYAPLKSPRHPVPSGDRRMARLLLAALRRSGHTVQLASGLRSWDGRGDARRQARIRALGARRVEKLLQRYENAPAPGLWFTYHAYHKAPDWLGPAVSARLGIPYVVAEASVAAKQQCGPWATGHLHTVASLRQASAVLTLNPSDIEGIAPFVPETRVHLLKPFIDFDGIAVPESSAAPGADVPRGWRDDVPHLVTVAMMRPGDKLESYRLLAHALRGLQGEVWQLVTVGDGAARSAVEQAFSYLPSGRVLYAGRLEQAPLMNLLCRCDLFVWPAINEAYGMALLEAQACGLPVVAGRSGGVAGIVADSRSGLLVAPGDSAALMRAVGVLLSDPDRRRAMGSDARVHVEHHHGLDSAGTCLDRIVRGLPIPGAGT